MMEYMHNKFYVAPHVGAWIETVTAFDSCSSRCVAPHVGAWIETTVDTTARPAEPVAPHIGA